MKIVYVADFPIPAKSANCIQSLLMCEALAAQGHEVEIVALHNPARHAHRTTMEDALGRPFALPIHSIVETNGRGRKLRGALAQLMLARSLQPDLIYSLSWMLSALAALRGSRTIFESHLLINPRRLKHRIASAIFAGSRKFLRLVATSHTLAGDWRSEYNFPQAKLCVAYNGAALPPPRSAAAAPAPQLRVGYTGFLYPGKGMEIIAQLVPRCPSVHFHIVGGPDERVQHWKQQLAGYANITLHGPLPHAAVPAFQQGMDLLLAPYQEEVGVIGGAVQPGRWITPMKVFEYMGAGVALIASNLAVAQEVVRNGENGLLVPPQDIDAWAGAIHRLQADPAERARLAAAALQDLQDKYTWNARARIVFEGLEAGAAA